MKNVLILHGTNEHGEYLKEKLDAELVVMPGQYHFSTEHGPKYTKFPEILRLIK